MWPYDGSVQRAAFDSSEKDRWTMSNTRFSVFAAHLQCTDEVKFVSIGTLRSQMQLTGEIDRRNDEERGGGF